jgi:iron complex transport system ATP-binding protein
MLEIKNVSAGYGDAPVLKDISFRALNGELLMILGPNGCGKSTLLKTIAAILPFTGSIFIDNKNISKFSRRDIAKKLSLLSQTNRLYFPYTVYDTVALGRYAWGNRFANELTREDKNFIDDAIKRMDLWDLKQTYIDRLSGGQLQRVFLARTLAQNPAIILLDEPTNHLDLKNQIELLNYLMTWAKANFKIVIGVFHDINLVAKYADKTILLKDGKIEGMGSTEHILNRDLLYSVYDMDVHTFFRDSLARWN